MNELRLLQFLELSCNNGVMCTREHLRVVLSYPTKSRENNLNISERHTEPSKLFILEGNSLILKRRARELSLDLTWLSSELFIFHW